LLKSGINDLYFLLLSIIDMINWKSIILGFVLLVTVNFGCRRSAKEEPAPALKAEDYLDLSYGADSQNTLDLYLPQVRDSSTPVIIMLHGGSWAEGDKSAFTDLAKYLRSKGFATASMNYRLTHTAENHIHPAQVNDIGKAIEFISSKAKEWQISPDHMGLLGISAGAHLALLYTYAYTENNKIKTVISLAAPSDFTDITNADPLQIQAVQALIGSAYQDNPAAYIQASPITHISGNSKPTLLFHGKLDDIVPYSQSVNLKNKLDQFQVANKLIIYENTGHEVVDSNNVLLFLTECENWFKIYLK
jgi:acetyl esterase/lipase